MYILPNQNERLIKIIKIKYSEYDNNKSHKSHVLLISFNIMVWYI